MESSKSLSFSITTTDSNLGWGLLDGQEKKTLADGLTIVSKGGTIHETAVPFPETYTFLIQLMASIPVEVAVGLLTNYIYDKLQSKPETKLKIGKLDVKVEKREIQRVILENLELTKE